MTNTKFVAIQVTPATTHSTERAAVYTYRTGDADAQRAATFTGRGCKTRAGKAAAQYIAEGYELTDLAIMHVWGGEVFAAACK